MLYICSADTPNDSILLIPPYLLHDVAPDSLPGDCEQGGTEASVSDIYNASIYMCAYVLRTSVHHG